MLGISVYFILPSIVFSSSEIDPWFEENRNAQPLEAVVSEDNLNSWNICSPKEMYLELMARYNELPKTAITRRLSILESLLIYAPEYSATLEPLIKEVGSTYQEIQKCIVSVAASNMSLFEVKMALQPWSDTISENAEFLDALFSSLWMKGLKNQISYATRNGNFDGVERLNFGDVYSDLDRKISEELEKTIRQSIVAAIERKIDATTTREDFQPFESYLFGRLIGSSDRKLNVLLDFPGLIDQSLVRQIEQDFQNRWGNSFNILTEAGLDESDLIVSFKIDPTEVKRDEESKKVDSQIPGKTVESPNPKFLQLSNDYSMAARKYESEMKRFELLGNVGFEGYKDDNSGESAALQNQALQNEDPVSMPINSSGSDSSSSAFDSLVSGGGNDIFIIKAEQDQVQFDPGMETHRKPEARHLDILERLSEMESVIVDSEDPTPYEYTQKTINFSIRNECNIALKIPYVDGLDSNKKVDLAHNRSWTENTGVHRNDYMVVPGTYSEEAFDSALKLFNLEFGSKITKVFAELLLESEEKIQQGDLKNGMNTQLIGLSLSVLKDPNEPLLLSVEELISIAKSLQNSELETKDLRQFIHSRLLHISSAFSSSQ